MLRTNVQCDKSSQIVRSFSIGQAYSQIHPFTFAIWPNAIPTLLRCERNLGAKDSRHLLPNWSARWAHSKCPMSRAGKYTLAGIWNILRSFHLRSKNLFYVS